MLRYLLFRAGQFIVTLLPLQAAYRFAICLSDCQYFFSAKDRQAVKENLQAITQSDGDLKQETRQVFRNFGKYLVDFMRMEKDFNDQFMRDKVKVIGKQHLDEALNRGKGVIILSAHMGNWEMGALIIGTFNYPFWAVALPHKQKLVNNYFTAKRNFQGCKTIPMTTAVRHCYKVLKDNALLALVGDRDFGNSGVEVDFLGRKAPIPKGPAVFALKTGAAIVPTIVLREPNDGFSITFSEPIIPPEADNDRLETQTVDLMNQYLPKVEEAIKKHPTQWLVFRRFWQR